MLKNHKFIVFCEEHYNPLGAIRSLGENGFKPIVVVLKSAYRCASYSKFIDQCYFIDTIEQGYNLIIDKWGDCKDSYKTIIITCDDRITEFLDAHYDDLKESFIFYNAGESGRISYFMDKYNILQIAQECGLKTPEAWAVDKGEIPEDITYPIITKSISPNIGGWKNDVFICNNEEELKEAYQKILSPKVLLQRYIDKKNELCLDGFTVAHGNELFISIASDYNYLLPNTYSQYMRVFNFNDGELFEKIKLLFSKIGFEGIFSLEFLIDKQGNKYFSEINFRNSGWSYASTCAGMPLPVFWAESMLSGGIKTDYLKQIPEKFNAMVELDDFRVRVLKRQIGLFKWLKQKRQCKCLFLKGKNDPKPRNAEIKSIIKRKIFKGKH